MRLRIWSWMQGVSIVLGFWLSPWFWSILAIQLYVVLTLMRDVWFATFIRKWFYRLIFKHELRKMISDNGGPIAYPLLIEIEFNAAIEKEYIEVGHDRFVKWMIDFTQGKADGLIKATHGAIEPDEDPPVDPETEALMKEAMSQEYIDVAFEKDLMHIYRNMGIVAESPAKARELHKLMKREDEFFNEQL